MLEFMVIAAVERNFGLAAPRIEAHRPCIVCERPKHDPLHELPHHLDDEPPWWPWTGTATALMIDLEKVARLQASATG